MGGDVLRSREGKGERDGKVFLRVCCLSSAVAGGSACGAAGGEWLFVVECPDQEILRSDTDRRMFCKWKVP
jgi:hypothetical protein